MKKAVLISLAVLCVAAVGFGLSRTSAKQGVSAIPLSSDRINAVGLGQSVNCTRLLTPPILDGQVNDWPFGDTITLDESTAYSFSGEIDSPSDLSASVRSGWDEQHLYLLVQVADDIIVTDSTDVWRDDGLEIGLDGLHDQYPWGSDDHQYTILADGRQTDRVTPTTAITSAVLHYEGGYNIEVAIPILQLIPGTPISGTVVGFTVGLHDDDDGDNWDAYLIWQGTNTSTSPEEFGSLVFVERVEDRLAVLEARIVRLEDRIRELLAVLAEFEELKSPMLTDLSATPVSTEAFPLEGMDTSGSSSTPVETPTGAAAPLPGP